MGAMGTTRQVLRLYRWIAMFRAGLAGYRNGTAGGKSLEFDAGLEVVGKCALGVYFLADNLVFASKVGLWQPSKELDARLAKLSNQAWLVEIFTGLLISSYKLWKLREKEESKLVKDARVKEYRALVRNVADVGVCLHGLDQTGKHPHGHFGLLGVLSTSISLWEMWPVILYAAKKA